MAALDYKAFQKTATGLITDFGGTGTLVRDETSTKVKMVKVQPKVLTDAGMTVGVHESGFYIAGTSKFSPLPGDIITFGTSTITVSQVNPVNPDGKTQVVHLVVGG